MLFERPLTFGLGGKQMCVSFAGKSCLAALCGVAESAKHDVVKISRAYASVLMEQEGQRFRSERSFSPEVIAMHGIVYIVGLIVIVMAILSFIGLR